LCWRVFEFVAEEVLGGRGVAGCGVVADAEDQRQVEGVGAGGCGEGFAEDAVGADFADGAAGRLDAPVDEHLVGPARCCARFSG